MTTSDDGTSDLLTALKNDVRTLLREEALQIRTELEDSIRGVKRSSILLTAGALLGAVATGTAATFVIRALDAVVPRPVSALIATGAVAAGAAAATTAGLTELRRSRDELAARV